MRVTSFLCAILGTLWLAQTASASISFGDVTEFSSTTVPDFPGGIYPVGGSGIGNGDFSIDTNDSSGLQVGLRAGLRFFGPLPTDGVPGDATYFAPSGNSPVSGSDPTPAPGLATWNFYFHFDQRGVPDLAQAASLFLTVDLDPTAGTNLLSVDLLPLFPALPMGEDALLIQGSQNLGFGGPPFDTSATGTYDFTLEARDATGAPLASTSIHVNVANVPEATALVTWAGLGLLGFVGVRRRRTSRAIS